MDYSRFTDHFDNYLAHGTSKHTVYKASTLSTARMEAVRKAAYLTFAMGRDVFTATHSNECQDATELSTLAN